MASVDDGLVSAVRPRLLGSLSLGLSRELWLVQIGIFLNALGWGAVLPFESIYLHEERGLSLGTAGLAVGTLTGVASAFAAAAVGGAGNGALLPAQSSLLTALAERDVRHRAGAVSRVCTNAGFGLGGALGGLVASFGSLGL